MKKALLLAIASLLICGTHAQVKWHTIEEASKATIGDRLYLVDFYTSWCGYCKKMDRETFTDPTVVALLDRYFYPVKFNAEGHNTFTWNGYTYRPASGSSRVHSFAKAIKGYPSFALFRADGSLLQIIPGFYPAADFTTVLWYFASGDYQRFPNFEQYSQRFDHDFRPIMQSQLKAN
ncbi:MAG: thioredoxin fold domain-containing protein [Bacteroidales bacterium]|nr:thioredoxin fold domain-containing protein [Bacteroidales bacterium]